MCFLKFAVRGVMDLRMLGSHQLRSSVSLGERTAMKAQQTYSYLQGGSTCLLS